MLRANVLGMCSIPNYKGPQELYLSQIKDDFSLLTKIGVEFISILKIISRARILIKMFGVNLFKTIQLI